MDDVYQCLPNPWGSGSTHTYFRFPDSAKVGGCLLYGNLRTRIQKEAWIFMGGGPPYLPRITFDQDRYCLSSYGGSVVNLAHPGDSIDIEYKMTPSDTIVSDTLRGWFKAYYRGDVVGEVAVGARLSAQAPARWTNSGIPVPGSLPGPFDLRDLRGRSLPLRPRSEGDHLLLVPERPPAPGLYRLRWRTGQTPLVVPGN